MDVLLVFLAKKSLTQDPHGYLYVFLLDILLFFKDILNQDLIFNF